MKVVASGAVFQIACEPGMKFDPDKFRRKPELPAGAVIGEKKFREGPGTGVCPEMIEIVISARAQMKPVPDNRRLSA